MRALALNGTMMDVPFIIATKRLGYEVFTTGMSQDTYGHDYASAHIPGDYSDLEQMTTIIDERDIDAVLCCTSDNCALTAALIGDKLGLPGHDSYDVMKMLSRKIEFKEFCREHDVLTPFSDVFTSPDDALRQRETYKYPVIVKPTNSAGGKGVTRVDKPEDYENAVNAAFEESFGMAYDKGKGGILVEPYIMGRLFSTMVFIVDGAIRTYAAWEDYPYTYPYMVSRGHTVAPEDMPYVRRVVKELQKIVDGAGLVDGQLNSQFIVQDETPWIIEVMRRSPGNYTTTFASMCTGIDWNEWIVRAELGLDCSDVPTALNNWGFYGYATLLSPIPGTFKDVLIDESIVNNVVDIKYWQTPGHKIDYPTHDKMGLVHLCFDSIEEMREKMANIHEMAKVEVV